MDVAPLVSAYRYRFHVLDAYGARTGGLARPAVTIEEALRLAANDLKLVADPPGQLKRLAHRINAETRTALRDVIARAENDLALAITRFGSDIGAPPTGPHIDLRATLDGLDRSYRALDPAPDDFDGWYDQLDAQIAHLSALLQLERDLEVARGGTVIRVPDSSSRRFVWILAVVGAAGVAAAGAIAFILLTRPAAETPPAAEQTAATTEQPRRVRTVPITVAPTPAVDTPATPPTQASICRTFEVEVVAEGATLLDAPLGGQPVARLGGGEKAVLRQVVDLGPTRLVEVEVPARSARGFIGERDVRLPVLTWTCDR